MTLKNISDFPDTPRRFTHGHAWGPWVLDAERLCLCLTRGGSTNPNDGVYEIDLETVTNTFWMVDWLAQIEEKTWAKPEVLGHLTRAFIHIFGPRNRMRPSLPNPAFDVLAILRHRIERDWSDGQ